MKHTRRDALVAFSTIGLAVPAVLLPAAALAQTAPSEGGDQSDYVVQTLTVGTLALQTSQIAAEKATDPLVKEFAMLEVGEQTAIASILASTEAGKAPPALPPEDASMVQQLQDAQPGPDFDAMYVQGQIDGHNRLLEIQKTLSQETVATVEAITARLAEQAVTSHIAMLRHIQQHLSSGEAGGSGGDTTGTSSSESSSAPSSENGGGSSSESSASSAEESKASSEAESSASSQSSSSSGG